MHEGHRQRILERFRRDEGSLQDHELLEILLFNAIPRKNTNEIAHNLLSAFGSLEGVFQADFDALLGVDGIGESTAAYLRCIALFYEKVRFGKKRAPALFSAEGFGAYLTERYSVLSDEVVEIYCLDAHNRIRFSKRFTSNQADKVRLAPEEVSKFIVGQHPYGLVLAHNHPKGNCTPSAADDNFTAQIQMLCSINNIRLYDHLIVGEDGWYSYYLTGRMEEIKRAFSVQNIIGKRL